MSQLVVNELRHSRVVLVVLIAVVAVVAATCALIEDEDLTAGLRFALVFVPVYFGLSQPALSFRAESRGDTWRLLRALPASGSRVVSAKVCGSLIVLALGTCAALAGLIVADGHGSFSQAFATLGLPLVLAVALLGINFALCFWVGERNAGVALMAVLVLLQVVGIGQIAVAPRGGGIGGLIATIKAWAAWAATPIGLLICGVTAGAILAACWLASIKIYDGRDITRVM